MTLIKEYDVVEATKDLNEKVSQGCIGTVVMDHKSSPPAYEVEFIDENFITLDVLTVRGDEIIKIDLAQLQK